MIPKDERDRDRTICEAATPGPLRWWTSNSHRRLRSDSVPRDVAYGTKHRDGVDDIVISEQDMAALANGANRLPLYIDALDEMERHLAALVATLPRCMVHVLDTDLPDLRAVRCEEPASHAAYDYRREAAVCTAHADEIRTSIVEGEVEGPLPYADPLVAALRILRGGQ